MLSYDFMEINNKKNVFGLFCRHLIILIFTNKIYRDIIFLKKDFYFMQQIKRHYHIHLHIDPKGL